MAQSKEFVDASHALNDLSHALALLESENASLRGAVDGLCNENAKLRELCAGLRSVMWACAEQRCPHRHDDCFVVNGNGDGPKGHGECWYEYRMHELGVVE